MPFSHSHSHSQLSEPKIEPVYTDLGNRLGFYSNYPGADPVIYLNSFLMVGIDLLKRTVYRRLLEFHNSIPADSWQRGFPFIKYFGELEPPVSWPELLSAETIMTLGTFTRSPGSERQQITTWRVKVDRFKLIG